LLRFFRKDDLNDEGEHSMDRRRFLTGLTAATTLPLPALAQESVESFYKGKNITLIVPTSPGGINDISGRLLSRHFGRFLPGNPNVVVQNVPGGGGLVAANKLYNTSERDGSVISLIQRGTMQVQIQGNSNAKFDPQKFTWLGSLSSYTDDGYLLLVNHDHPAQTSEDLRKSGIVANLARPI
jgi:tripartite-type tricarboxylate transporter receptor subunit TctC